MSEILAPKKASKLLGHTKKDITERIYRCLGAIPCPHNRSSFGTLSFLPAQRSLKFDPADSKKPRKDGASKVAEAQRFELWDPCESAVFKTAALNHSATLP